jgi:hypothetical protein
MKPKSIKLFWTLGLLAVLLLASAVATVRLAPRLFPSQYVSDIYRAYADQPGIEATFLHNFPVNDTLSLDVTTLKATTDSAWAFLQNEFGITILPPEIEKLLSEGATSVDTWLALENNLKESISIKKYKPEEKIPNLRLVAVNRKDRTISIFTSETKEQRLALLSKKINELSNK